MKVLIVGHSRSGTTLLRKLFRSHRHVKHVLHETMLLVANRGKVGSQYLMYAWYGKEPISFRFDSDMETWGEKILYDYPCLDHGVVDALDYCLFWNETFLPDAKIVQIIRHPFDVVLSSARKKKISVDRAIEIYKHWLPWIWEAIDNLPNSKLLKFEDLISATDIALEGVYDYCSLDCSRSARKEALSRVRPDIQNGRLDPDAVFRHANEWWKVRDKGLEEMYYNVL